MAEIILAFIVGLISGVGGLLWIAYAWDKSKKS